jgi:hypothetical protein
LSKWESDQFDFPVVVIVAQLSGEVVFHIKIGRESFLKMYGRRCCTTIQLEQAIDAISWAKGMPCFSRNSPGINLLFLLAHQFEDGMMW